MIRVVLAAAGLIVLAFVELALRHALADGQIVASLLAPGAHSSLSALLFAALFLGVRLSLWVLAPALFAGWLGAALGRAILERRW